MVCVCTPSNSKSTLNNKGLALQFLLLYQLLCSFKGGKNFELLKICGYFSEIFSKTIYLIVYWACITALLILRITVWFFFLDAYYTSELAFFCLPLSSPKWEGGAYYTLLRILFTGLRYMDATKELELPKLFSVSVQILFLRI